MPDHPQLRDGFLAWDRGDYPTALRAYLDVLNGPSGAEHVREIALLTGEIFRVIEVAADGTNVRVAPDGSIGTFEVVEGGGRVTRLVDLGSGAVVSQGGGLSGGGAVLGSSGNVAYFEVEETPALQAARQAAAQTRRSPDRDARARAQAALRWEEAQARTAFLRSGGAPRRLDLAGRVPLSLTFDLAGDELFALASDRDRPGDVGIYRFVDAEAQPVLESPGQKANLMVVRDGRLFVFETPEGVTVADASGAATTFAVGVGPSLSRDGTTLSFLRIGSPGVSVHAVSLGGSATGLESRVVYETERPLSNAVVSPDGRHVAYQKMAVDDWEIFVAATDGSGERQLSLEIQHDRQPTWVDESRVLAAKGEGRHMRTFVYDVNGGTPIKLFHNNSIRTIAPEYEWAVTADGSKVLMVSERDGDTVSPERGVYLVDLSATVTVADVRARLQESLAAEEDLRRRGEAAFAPIARDVAAVADAVTTARIYEYARDVYAFGSKHITQPGNAMAIEYYEAALRSFGYEPELQWFEPRPGIRSANIVVTIPGTVNPELVYVASSHFDSVERGPGADDDSSGATALLEAARVLKGHAMPATIELAFFTGEEAGLLGSREYVRRAVAGGKRIVGALNNDMIGWANDHRLDNTIRYSNPGIRDVQHAAAIQFSNLITYDALYYKSTDAAAYYEAYGDIVGGIGSYPVLGNPHYHQSTDRLETINQQLVAEVTKTTVATLMLLASSPARVDGLSVSNGGASWDASPERGVSEYEVRWRSSDGWRSTRVAGSTASLDGVVAGSEVSVRAVHERGTVGWDWARATAR